VILDTRQSSQWLFKLYQLELAQSLDLKISAKIVTAGLSSSAAYVLPDVSSERRSSGAKWQVITRSGIGPGENSGRSPVFRCTRCLQVLSFVSTPSLPVYFPGFRSHSGF